MKTIITPKKESRNPWFLFSLAMKTLILTAFMATGIQTALQAQDVPSTRPSWYFGVAGGVNFNFYRGTTQQLNSGFTAPAAFHNGNGRGLFLAPLVEFHKPGTRLGFMLQAGYDNRQGTFNEILTPCNCPANLTADISYITVEPSLRFAPFRSDFYLFGGPRVAVIRSKSFTYSQEPNPAFPEQVAGPDIEGEFSLMNKTLFSMQVGAGYDIQLSSQNRKTQFVLSPFVAFHPYFGQDPRNNESWNVTTVRAGAALKLGRGKNNNAPASPRDQTPTAFLPDVKFSVNAPGNIPVERRVRETFPLRNYVFFDLGSTEIPDRYVLLKKNQVAEFKEDRLEEFKPKKLSGRSARQMIVYYNVINILGARMGENPSSSIVLVGSSEKGPEDGRVMSECIKEYLTGVFGIDASRIKTEGRHKPKLPSEQPGGTRELDLLREGDRRVSVESSSPALLMEFQSGPDAPLKPVEIRGVQEAPLDSYVAFNADGSDEAFNSWSLEIRDEVGTLQNFGPYSQERIVIPGKAILGARPQGDYKVTMVGKTQDGRIVRKETPVHMVLWTPPQNEEGMRYSIIYEFNESKAIAMYEKYLTEIVAPKIPQGGTVIIHGHTDLIGDEAHNRELSMARANDVKKILEKSLSGARRSDVKFDVYGFGEDERLAPFENGYPEERFYNRTVIIDIIPRK